MEDPAEEIQENERREQGSKGNQYEKAPDTAQPDREAACPSPATSLSFRKRGRGGEGAIVFRSHITHTCGTVIVFITVMLNEVRLDLRVRKRPNLQNRQLSLAGEVTPTPAMRPPADWSSSG